MDADDEIRRRDLLVGAAVSGVVAGVGLAPTLANAASKPPPGFDEQQRLIDNWNKPLNEIVNIDLHKEAAELADPAVQERHRIYCHLLMKLIHRFWNGNKHGPVGRYPYRKNQLEEAGLPDSRRFPGDMMKNTDQFRVNWDRYLGHNIACLAVDGNGDIIDFDFNHNEFFRSTAEHAESRMVRRLFSLTNIFDGWCYGQKLDKGKPAMLDAITLYTSLESCAQCSGVMSLAGVKQVVYLQNDFTTYKIGNIMYNLANQNRTRDKADKPMFVPGAPLPIAGSDIGLEEFKLLTDAHLEFIQKIRAAGSANPPDTDNAFFVPDQGDPDFSPSITSFLCTDAAREIFRDGGHKLDTLDLTHKAARFPNEPNDGSVRTNAGCLAHAREFYRYADVEGYRGSPHKL
jgi:tRNA(Arg) A34 adenosine deaminase TadA